MIGRTIGKYRIVGQLGQGGMGIVYEAVDEVLGRHVAIKILNARLADSDTLERFRREAILLARLNHPRIATIYELFRSDAELMMVMERVRGETLDRIANRMGPLPPDRAAYLVDHILSALGHAHNAGIVHRDMKPANVMLTEEGDIKVMDFGIARVRVVEHVESYMVGTPAYMSPEQVLGENVDARADLYSVGVTLYRLLTGMLPFSAETEIAMLEQHLWATPTPVRVHREDLPGWCETVIQRALAKTPDERFQTADEFREKLAEGTGIVSIDLSKVLPVHITDHEVISSSPTSMLERFGATRVPRGTAHAPTQVVPHVSASVAADHTPTIRQAWQPPPRRWQAAILAGTLTMLVMVALWHATAPTKPAGDRPVSPASPPPSEDIANTGRTRVPPVPADGGSSSSSSSSSSTRRSAELAPPGPAAAKTAESPRVFRARALVSDGEDWRERECQIILLGDKITVQANDDQELLYAVAYSRVTSISYSQGRDPLWNSPSGTRRIARVGNRALALFRPGRHWVSLHTTNANSRFVVLRLANADHARQAITAIEERTGRTAKLVTELDDQE